MASFSYTGRTSAGTAIRGRIEATSTAGVVAELAGKGIVPLEIVASGADGSQLFAGLERWWHERSITLTDVIMFCRQMSTLIRAGVPITRGLRGLAETMRNP